MAHIVTAPCISRRHADCVEVCPVDCFHLSESRDMLLIDPLECIDCGVCVAACPENGIFMEEEVPEQWQEYIAINASEAASLPVVTTREAGRRVEGS